MNGCHIQPEQFFNLIFGYYDRYLENVSTTNASAGTNTLNGTAVSTGEVWVVTAITLRNVNKANVGMEFGIYADTTHYRFASGAPTTADFPVSFYGHLFLKAGDKIQGIIYSCDAGNDLYMEISGYKMKVA